MRDHAGMVAVINNKKDVAFDSAVDVMRSHMNTMNLMLEQICKATAIEPKRNNGTMNDEQ